MGIARVKTVVAAAVFAVGNVLMFVTVPVYGSGYTSQCVSDAPAARPYIRLGDVTAVGETTVTLSGQPSEGCGGDQVVSYQWNSGDGAVGNEVEFTHTYGIGVWNPTLTVTDEAGLTHSKSVTVAVKAANEAPVVTSDVTVEQAIFTDDTYVFVDLKQYASDPDGDSLQWSRPQNVVSADGVTVGSGTGEGLYVFKLASGVTTTQVVSFDYAVSDEFGGETTAHATVKLGSEFAQPTAKDFTVSVNEDSSVVRYLPRYTNDSELLGDQQYAVAQAPTNGTATIVNGNEVEYRPNHNYHGTDTFTYQIQNGQYVATATVSVSVVSTNDAPQVSGQAIYTTEEDTTVTGNLADYVTDVDGDNLTYTVAWAPDIGALQLNPDGTFTYTPRANDSGKISFTYDVTDGEATTRGRFTIDVTPVNDIPTVSPIQVQVNKHSMYFAVTASDVETRYLSYVWDFGDGTSATTTIGSTAHSYQRRGTYTVTLTVMDAGGAAVMRTVQVTK